MVKKSLQAIGYNPTLERIVKQNPFKMWTIFTKTGRQLESALQEPRRYMQNKGFSCRIPCVKPLLNYRQRFAWVKDKNDWTAAKWSKVMFLWKWRSQILEQERQDTEYILLKVQCKVSTNSDGLVYHVVCCSWWLCFLRSKVNALELYPIENL